ncbi:hypothetical protein BGZ60DRAFT_422195 [Tricladium varicosporioides]|nr:hypothetical protein BGZ60DRAFT_422195 [Hymenoscyphus varicosporioides]
MNSRVCDSCIRKKVKCDQRRPTCSRCFDRGETCSYTLIRRKPGPPRSSQRTPLSSKSQRSSVLEQGYQNYEDSPQGLSDGLSPAGSISRTEELVVLERLTPMHVESPQNTGSSTSLSDKLDISAQQEEDLLEKFFDIVQDVNPIFSKALFFHNYRNSTCSRELISTIVPITAKLIGFTFSMNGHMLDACIDQMLSSSLLDGDMFGDSPNLDQFRKACLLAFYEFHQYPGNQSWMRIGKLTRMAYRIGIDRLETLRSANRDWSAISKEDIEEWRSVWWCIYRLDSYSNISSGTPYLIDERLVNTALIVSYHAPQEIFLPSQPADLWKLIRAVTLNPETLLMNIHIITATAMRQAGLIMRVHFLQAREETIARLANVERHISALRQALPPGWLNPRRNAFSNESHVNHHARLVTVLHLRMAQLLLAILNRGRGEESEWPMSWQQVLEVCQDIASISEQWDSSFCLKVDPAISFILFTALIFLDLHKKSTAISRSNLLSSIDHHMTVLRLQLEQFAYIWTLPRLLALSFESFSESVPGPLPDRHISFILSRFEAPLHPRWLQFLSSAKEDLDSSP